MRGRMRALRTCLRPLWAVPLIALFLLSAQPASAWASIQLTVDVSPTTGGTVKVVEETPTLYPAVYTYTTVTVVQLTATPKQGYIFTGWSGVSAETTPTISITMDCVKKLTANFAPIKYHVSASASLPAMGEVTLDPQQPNDGYVIGTRVYLRATPYEGYVFKEWTGGASGSDAVTSIIVDANKTVAAVFEAKRSKTSGWVWGGTGAGLVVIGLTVYLVRSRKR